MHRCGDMQAVLGRYGHFGEWIIRDVLWQDYGTTLVLVLENGRSLSSTPPESRVVRLSFSSIQEFHLSNALNAAMLQEMSAINWGLSQIARIQIDHAVSFTSRYADLPVRFYHAGILWEGSRRIDIVFASLTVTAGQADEPNALTAYSDRVTVDGST